MRCGWVVVQKWSVDGAVCLGKPNLSGWANFRGCASFNGWGARGVFTRNPYLLHWDPCGSSSGSAAAAAAYLCAAAIGTETDGAQICAVVVVDRLRLHDLLRAGHCHIESVIHD